MYNLVRSIGKLLDERKCKFTHQHKKFARQKLLFKANRHGFYKIKNPSG